MPRVGAIFCRAAINLACALGLLGSPSTSPAKDQTYWLLSTILFTFGMAPSKLVAIGVNVLNSLYSSDPSFIKSRTIYPPEESPAMWREPLLIVVYFDNTHRTNGEALP